MRVVKLYVRYDHGAAAAIRKLGYPNRYSPDNWFKECSVNGSLHERMNEQARIRKR